MSSTKENSTSSNNTQTTASFPIKTAATLIAILEHSKGVW